MARAGTPAMRGAKINAGSKARGGGKGSGEISGLVEYPPDIDRLANYYGVAID